MSVAQILSIGNGGGEFRHLAWRIYRGRWFTIFMSCLVMSASGSTYLFGLYSNEIKSSLGYDQTTINLISFFKDTGTNVGVISGLINEVAPPWVVLLIGSVFNFGGYFMMWLAVTGKITKPHIWQMCVYMCLGANAQCFTDTGARVTSVQNFPNSRGVVVGLLNGLLGLSGAIITQLYYALYGDDPKGLILLIAYLPSVVYLLSVPIMRIIKVVQQANELKVFYNFLYITLALAGYLIVIIILQKSFHFSQAGYGGSAALVIILIFSPLALVVREETAIWKTKKQIINNLSEVNVSVENLPKAETKPVPIQMTVLTNSEKQNSCWSTMFNTPKRGDDFTILQALVSGDMLIIFIASICGIGGTTTVIDNLGQIGATLGYSTGGINTFISLVSVWSYFGRVGSGFGSEILLTRYRFPRTLMLTLILLVSCIGHLLIAFPFHGSVYAASMITGFCLGAQWSLVFVIISELFGLKYYSTLSSFGCLASPIGSYLLNVLVAGHLYDREAIKQKLALGLTRESGEDLTCNGVHCYRLAFIIIAASTFFGTVISFILVLRTREFYKGDIYKKFRDTSVIAEAEMGGGGLEAVNVKTTTVTIKNNAEE